jgi:hypothetical protein
MITDYVNQSIQGDIWPLIGVVTLALLIILYVTLLSVSCIHPITTWKSLEIYSTKRKQQYISDAARLLKAGLSKVRHLKPKILRVSTRLSNIYAQI